LNAGVWKYAGEPGHLLLLIFWDEKGKDRSGKCFVDVGAFGRLIGFQSIAGRSEN
jgi:hypothetical protein